MSTYAAYSPNANASYRASAVLTASPGQLVVMLYDGARRFLHQAAVGMGERDIPPAQGGAYGSRGAPAASCIGPGWPWASAPSPPRTPSSRAPRTSSATCAT